MPAKKEEPIEETRQFDENGGNIKTIGYRYGRRFNMGNFERLDMEVTYFSDVDPNGGDPEKVLEDLIERASDHVKAKALPLILKARDEKNIELREEIGRLNDEIAGIKADYVSFLHKLIVTLGDEKEHTKITKAELTERIIGVVEKSRHIADELVTEEPINEPI